MAAYEVLLLNTAIPQIQAAQTGDTYVVPRDIAFSAALTLSAGTANGVPYLNASKVVTTGSALTFDGTKLVATATTGAATTYPAYFDNSGGGVGTGARIGFRNTAVSYGEIGYLYDGAFATIIDSAQSGQTRFLIQGTEQARLTSSGLEIKQSQLIGYSSFAGIGSNGLAVLGSVGIGTASPGGKLDVTVADANPAAKFNGATGKIRFNPYSDATNGAVIDSSNAAENAYLPLSLFGSSVRLGNGAQVIIDSSGNLGLGGSAARATTAGAAILNIFNGTAPVGTLTNGISLYSSSGEAYVMDAAGNATLFSPHDSETNEWIFKSKHTPTGKVLRIDVERLLRFVNDHFGLDAVKEFVEE